MFMVPLLFPAESESCLAGILFYIYYIQGCIQKFKDSTCKKKFAYLGC